MWLVSISSTKDNEGLRNLYDELKPNGSDLLGRNFEGAKENPKRKSKKA